MTFEKVIVVKIHPNDPVCLWQPKIEIFIFHRNSITSGKSDLTYPFGKEADVKRISFMHRSETVMLKTANRGWF